MRFYSKGWKLNNQLLPGQMANRPVFNGTSSKNDIKSMSCQISSLIIIKHIWFTLLRTQRVKMMHIFLYKRGF